MDRAENNLLSQLYYLGISINPPVHAGQLLVAMGQSRLATVCSSVSMQTHNRWLVGVGGNEGKYMALEDCCNEGRIGDCLDPGKTKSTKQ